MAKEMHVGHLRTTIIGDSLARLLAFLGADVVRANHLGDWGTQFGMLIQFIDENPDRPWRAGEIGDEATVSALDNLYKIARARFDTDPGFAARARTRVVALQTGDAATLAHWREIVAESERAFAAIYRRLGVLLTPDDYAGESFYNPMLAATTTELLDAAVAVPSDGAVIVESEQDNGPDGSPAVLMVRKRDGGYGYDSTDLATIRYRITTLGAHRLLYVGGGGTPTINTHWLPGAGPGRLETMTDNGFRFHDKIALITGGSSGMGLATAHRLLAEGATVIITGRDKQRLDDAVAQLGERATAIAGDATAAADLETLARVVRERFGRLDVVFVNAGIGAFQQVSQVTDDEFDRVVGVNFKAAFRTVQQVLPLLVDGGALIINASFAPYRGAPGAALYTASKAAVLSLARALAAELAPRGIRVNSVSPGYIDTPAFRAEASPEAQAGVGAQVALGRVGRSEDVAAAVAFLASGDASYITGVDLLVDGGLINVIPTAVV
ncbi:arginine--tRNA ligase [Nocardia seriolae]|nr:arginine--tRNA ligase [Nocardia seriolae]GEM24836.1 hypothetical protein NS2_30750 [Nocardia seriolae NBRC 15557]